MKKLVTTFIFFVLMIGYIHAQNSYTINVLKLPEYTRQEASVVPYGLNLSGSYIATETFVQPDVPRSLVYILHEDAWGSPIASCVITTWGKNQFGLSVRTNTYLGSGLFIKENPQVFSEITRIEVHGTGMAMGDLLFVGLGRKLGIGYYFEYTNDIWDISGTSNYYIDVRYKSLEVNDFDTVPISIEMTVAEKSIRDLYPPISITATPTPTSIPATTTPATPIPSPTPTPEYTPDGSADKPWMITNLAELQAMNNNVANHYILMNDINASETEQWNSGSGFVPIGNTGAKFSGGFNGNGYTISNLYVNRPLTDHVGFFGYLDNGPLIKNVRLTSATMIGAESVGILVGRAERALTTIEYCVVDGLAMGNSRTGGLVGYFQTGAQIRYCIVAGGTIVRRSGSSDTMFGGALGQNYRGSIMQSYSTAQVLYEGGSTTQRGFIGSTNDGGDGTYLDFQNYWDMTLSGQTTTLGSAIGLSGTNALKQASYVDWSFGTIWGIVEDSSHPYLFAIRWRPDGAADPTPTPVTPATPIPTPTPIDPAKIRYVRESAPIGGDGTSWATAWRELPFYWAGGGSRKSSDGYLHRGWTYYIADGTYPDYVFDTANTSEDTITIKKATDNDHGSSTGWQSSYGDGYALFTRPPDDFGPVLRFRSSNWVFDGQVGYSDGSIEGHGFRVGFPNPPSTQAINIVDFTQTYGWDTVSNVEIARLEVDGGFAGNPLDVEQVVGRTNAVYIPNGSDNPGYNVNFRYCYLHSVTVAQLRLDGLRESIIEHCYISDRIGGHSVPGSPIHGEAISANGSGAAFNTYRYNIFKNIRGTGVIVIKDSFQSDFAIYGNVLINLDPLYTTGNGAIANTGGDTNSNMLVYNNTFIGGYGGNFGVYWDGIGTGNEVYNNLWAGADNMNISSSATHDHNAFWNTGVGITETNKQTIIADPFIDFAGGNYRLSLSTDPGFTLPSPYNLDMTGAIRGNDGVWDRGAFEYISTP